MSTTLNPYLNWRSSAREAMEFYHSVFGGELTASTFKEFGMPVEPAEAELIMHSQLVTPDLTLMGADTPSHMPLAENPIRLAEEPDTLRLESIRPGRDYPLTSLPDDLR